MEKTLKMRWIKIVQFFVPYPMSPASTTVWHAELAYSVPGLFFFNMISE